MHTNRVARQESHASHKPLISRAISYVKHLIKNQSPMLPIARGCLAISTPSPLCFATAAAAFKKGGWVAAKRWSRPIHRQALQVFETLRVIRSDLCGAGLGRGLQNFAKGSGL